jgi:hypothetical protein
MKQITIKKHNINNDYYETDFDLYSFEGKEIFIDKNQGGAVLIKFIFDCCRLEFDFNDYYLCIQNDDEENYIKKILTLNNIDLRIIEVVNETFRYKITPDTIELNIHNRTLIVNSYNIYNIFKYICDSINPNIYNRNLYGEFYQLHLIEWSLNTFSKFFENRVFDNKIYEIKFEREINYDNY